MNIKIENALAVINDEKKYEIKKTDIFIKDGLIAGIGSIESGFKADKTIDGTDKLVIPGLVNSHTHSYMSVFRNMADDLAFHDWLFKNIMPREDILTSEDAYWGAMLACIEMIKTGTTSFLDMHIFKNVTAKAANDCGMRGVISKCINGNGRTDKSTMQKISDAVEEIEQWKDNDRISFMIAPHAIYTCSTDCLELTIEKAKEYGISLHTHLSETRLEVSEAKEKYNMTPVKYLDSLGFFDVNTVAAHCVHLEDCDFEILRNKRVNVALNPISNMKLGNGFAPVQKMLDYGINICMGTDSAASNNSLNLFSDMNHTALIHKGTAENAQSVTAFDVYKAATMNSARALKINSEQIEIGKNADLAILDLNCPQMRPKNNIMAALSYSANGSEVDTVIVAGKVIMENKKLLNVDENEVYKKVEEIAERIR